MATSIDEEMVALRDMCAELDRHIESIADEETMRKALAEEITLKCSTMNSDANSLIRRKQDVQQSIAAMRSELRVEAELELQRQEWLHKKQDLEAVLRKENEVHSALTEPPPEVLQERARSRKQLGEVSNFLDKYILSVVVQQLSSRGAVESRVGVQELETDVMPLMVEHMEAREKEMHELCQLVDYRLEESLRLESTFRTIAEQMVTDGVDAESAKDQQLHRIVEASNVERTNLMKILSRTESENKEIEYHVKRGTLAKRSTTRTPSELKWYDKIASQQEEVKRLMQEFEVLRSEKMQLEREAESALTRLVSSREEQKNVRLSVRAKLDDLLRFHEMLDGERQDWQLMRREMNELIYRKQTKVRADIEADALSR